jgi:hypothetical protein
MYRPNKLRFNCTMLQSPARDKQSSLLGPFVNYKEIEALCIVLPGGKHSSLLAQFVGYDENLKFKNYMSTLSK